MNSQPLTRNRGRAERRAQAKNRATAIWEASACTVGDHPYLIAKGISAHGIRVFGDELTISGMNCQGALVVPMRDAAGELNQLQFIAADGFGSTRFLPGTKLEGHYHLIGRPTNAVCIAVGYAAGASVAESTSLAVAVAFECTNLEAVATVIRGKMPAARIVICADDHHQHKHNPGMKCATAAASSIGGYLVRPDIGPDWPEWAKDFNDLAILHGAERVRRCIASAARVWSKPEERNNSA